MDWVRFIPRFSSYSAGVLGPEYECLVNASGVVVRWLFSNYFGSGHLAMAELKGYYELSNCWGKLLTAWMCRVGPVCVGTRSR